MQEAVPSRRAVPRRPGQCSQPSSVLSSVSSVTWSLAYFVVGTVWRRMPLMHSPLQTEPAAGNPDLQPYAIARNSETTISYVRHLAHSPYQLVSSRGSFPLSSLSYLCSTARRLARFIRDRHHRSTPQLGYRHCRYRPPEPGSPVAETVDA